MSSQQGLPQNDPPDERLQPESSEGVESHVRYVLDGVDISPNSIISQNSPTPERLQANSSTPTPNASSLQEQVQSHVTANSSTSTDPTDTPMAIVETEPVQSHVTLNTSSTQNTWVTVDKDPRNPVTPQGTVPPIERMVRGPYQPGQTILVRTRHGETPADYVSIGSDSPSPNRPPPSQTRRTKRSKTNPDDPMDTESPAESPSQVPSVINTSPSNSGSPSYQPISYAQMTKGKGRAFEDTDTPILSRTWCKLKEFEDTRIPPVTDAKYSAWLNLLDLYEDQGAIFEFAAQNPNIGALSYRPTPKWTEFYCKSEKQLETILGQEWTIGSSKVKLIPAKKLAGSRVFVKVTNMSPCHTDEEIRDAIRNYLATYGQVGQIEPHYIVDPTGKYPDARIGTRRWDAEVFIPEKTRLICDPAPELLGNQVVMYWKGQYPVCHHCPAEGHWSRNCNSTLRNKALADRLSKIPPAPIRLDETSPAQPIISVSQETQPESATPSQSTQQPVTKVTPKQTITPSTDLPQQTQEASTPVVVSEKDLIQQSRQINAAKGTAPSNETIIIRDDDNWTKVQSKKAKAAEREAEKRKTQPIEAKKPENPNKKARQSQARLASTAIEASNRPRTVGNQLQYYLYLVEHGHILQGELQTYIDKADPVTFITVTKPSMKMKSYESFTGWVARRRRANHNDLLDVQKWKVSIPDHMDHTNPSYIDTSISAKQYHEQEEKRKNKSCKLNALWQTENAQHEEEIIFKPKDRMSTIARNIKRKFKLGFMVDLCIPDTNNKLNMFVTADVAGLKDGSTVIVSRADSESGTETADNEIAIRIQLLNSAKFWTTKLPASASTAHLYHNVNQHTHQQHGHFSLHRSDGSRVSRYVTVGNLHLRPNEILFQKEQDPVIVDVKWLDQNREPQNKITFVDKEIQLDHLDEVLKEDLLLDFTFTIQTPTLVDDSTELKDIVNSAGKLEVQLRRVGQETWDNPRFEATTAPREIFALATYEGGSKNISMEVTPENTVADFVNYIYSEVPQTKGRILEDTIGLPYELTDPLAYIVPASGILLTRLNAVQQYTPEQMEFAVQTLAALRSTTAEELLNNEFASFLP